MEENQISKLASEHWRPFNQEYCYHYRKKSEGQKSGLIRKKNFKKQKKSMLWV